MLIFRMLAKNISFTLFQIIYLMAHGIFPRTSYWIATILSRIFSMSFLLWAAQILEYAAIMYMVSWLASLLMTPFARPFLKSRVVIGYGCPSFWFTNRSWFGVSFMGKSLLMIFSICMYSSNHLFAAFVFKKRNIWTIYLLATALLGLSGKFRVEFYVLEAFNSLSCILFALHPALNSLHFGARYLYRAHGLFSILALNKCIFDGINPSPQRARSSL